MRGSEAAVTDDWQLADVDDEGREAYFMDVDRMINEGLGGGNVTKQNGLIGDSTTDTIGDRETVFDDESI